ncbi:nucleotidyltransferase domain-containing protein [Candidatus Pacearchaeota archaeon]|nr:nucleotidyltransferase domain-containing protein [Candidatus Pacearchaeota archaeon]
MVSNTDSIPGMDLNYSKPSIPKVNPEEEKKKFEKTKKEIEKLKTFVLKKFRYVLAFGILPPQSIPKFIEEEEASPESKDSVHVVIIVPDEKAKEVPKIKQEIIKEIQKSKEKVWLHLMTPSEIWEICMDQKFELSGAIAMSYPIYDKGILGALRVSEIHKSLVLQKFEKYVVSYVIGGSLIRGDAVKTSDVDVFVIINDTDVKRMPRRELLERLRGIIYQYVAEATQIAGVKNRLEPQIYLLTDFWDAVKDAHPVMFTFIRDGVPLYDRGTFMPWKSLLRMGKLKPSPEAIDMFMSMGDGIIQRSKRTLLSDIFTNIFWGVTTPAQAILMLGGYPPPASKELVNAFKKAFFDTKMIEKTYVDFLEKVVKTWKDYEHEKIKEISGKEIDSLLKETEEYLKRLKELRKEIEAKFQEKTIHQIYGDVIELLKNIMGEKSQKNLVKEFEKEYIKKAKFTNQHLRILKDVVKTKKEFNKKISDSHKIDRVRKDAEILVKDLIEYIQRKDLISINKGKMILNFKDKKIEIVNADGKTFLFEGNSIKKVREKIEESSLEELEKALANQKDKTQFEINSKVFDVLKKAYGDFEIVF